MALAAHRTGDLAAAERLFKELLADHGDRVDLLVPLGILNYRLHRTDDAASYLRAAIALRSDVAEYHAHLGLVLHHCGQLDEAGQHYRKALELAPEYADAQNLLGCLALETGQWVAAVWYLEVALRLSPHHAAAHANLARALLGLSATMDGRRVLDLSPDERRDLALEVLHAAIVETPAVFSDPAVALSEIGLALVLRWRTDDGMALLNHALETAPNDPAVRLHFGSALARIGRFEASIEAYSSALQRCGERRHENATTTYLIASCHFMRAQSLLMLGCWDEGWAEHEWRMLLLRNARRYKQPSWDGEPLQGRRIFVYAEQGMGDIIQFLRFLPELRDRGATVVFECVPALARVALAMEAVAEVVVTAPPGGSSAVEAGPSVPMRFDCHAALLSIPFILGLSHDGLPRATPYLSLPPDEVERWRARLASDPTFKVGLAWAGNPAQRDDRDRSCRLEQLAPLGEVPGVRFYSLQIGTAGRQAPPPGLDLVDLTGDLHDMFDTAGLIANLDLVIGVDTAVVHLAGALGRPTFTLVRFAADWRWERDRDDSPWYPTMRLFRQTRAMDWDSVMLRVRDALARICGRRPARSPAPLLAATPAVAPDPPPQAETVAFHCTPPFELILDPHRQAQRRLRETGGELYEPAISRFILDTVQQGDTVIDVGAHVGYFSVLSTRKTDHVIVFEPDAANFRILEANLALNRARRAVAEQALVGAEEGQMRYFVHSTDDGGHALWNVSAQRSAAPMVTLDGYLSRRPPTRLKLIKISTEGAELEVLRGAACALAQFRVPYVLVTVNPFALQKLGTSEEELHDFMRQQQYEGCVLSDRGRGDWIPRPPSVLSGTHTVLFVRKGATA